MDKIIQLEANELYGKFYVFNDFLLQKSEQKLAENEIYSSIEIFDFYISSHALAYLKCLYRNDLKNISIYLSIRCILEGLALKKICQREIVNTIKEELLQKQVFLIEYKYYKKFNDIAEKILLPKKLKQDWQNTCEFYNKKLKNNFSSKKIKQIINSQIPFICYPYKSYRKIVEEELGVDCASLYGQCSLFIHPSINEAYKINNYKMVLPVFYLLKLEYSYLQSSKYSLNEDLKRTHNMFSNKFCVLITEETNILLSIADVFTKKYGNNYIANSFATIGYILPDLAIEKQLGLTEQIKCKWKIIIEIFAIFDFFYAKCFGNEQGFKLLKLHYQMQTNRNINKEINLDDSYHLYCEINKKHCDREMFNNAFKKELGYLIDENGNVNSLTNIVLEFAKKFNNNDNLIDRAISLDYMESQMLSHANGYMWFANSGAFRDVNNIFKAIDICLMYLIDEIHLIFKYHQEIEKKNDYKSIINILRNSKKRIERNLEEKINILYLPLEQKESVF